MSSRPRLIVLSGSIVLGSTGYLIGRPKRGEARLLTAAQNWKIGRKVHSVSADLDSRKYSAGIW